MTTLKEAGTLTAKSGGRFKIGVITPGTGSSGTYPQETIEAAGRDKVFAAGTHMYLDHATEAQSWERPEGSVKDLVGVLTEDAYWDNSAGSLVAEARIYSNWKSVLEEMKDDIGVSIRASGEVNESNGQRIVTRLTEARSVDFVTKAGRGGKILEVLESARQRVQEGVNDETRQLLQRAVRATHPDAWAYVRDHNDTTVWYDLEEDGGDTTYQQTYTKNGVAVELTGTAQAVFPTTTYVPLNTNPDPTGVEEAVTTQEEDATMAHIQIEEADHKALVEKAGRADAFEADLAEANRKLEAVEADKAKAARHAQVAEIVEEAFEHVSAPATKASLIDHWAATDKDSEAIMAEAKARAVELTGATGQVTGLGESAPAGAAQEAEKTTRTDKDIVNVLEGA